MKHTGIGSIQRYISQLEGKLPAETVWSNKVNTLDYNPEYKIPMCLGREINDGITQWEKTS